MVKDTHNVSSITQEEHKWLDSANLKTINSIFDKTNNNSELEISFKPLTLDNFKHFVNYIISRKTNDKLTCIKAEMLDVNFTYSDKAVYRITIYEKTNINSILNSLNILNSNNNNDIFRELIKIVQSKNNSNFVVMDKSSIIKYDIPEYELRFRLANEKILTNDDLNKIKDINKTNINYRFKSRLSLIIFDNSDVTLRLDITDVKSGRIIDTLDNTDSKYELELELKYKTNSKNKYEKILLTEAKKIIEQFQRSANIISVNESNIVIENFKQLLLEDTSIVIKDLPGMQVSTAEIIDIIDKLPHKYSVTDKADGSRYMLFIHNKMVYLIKNNLEITKLTDCLIDEKKLATYDNTILDGELLTLSSNTSSSTKYMFLSFDILYYKNENVTTDMLKERYKKMNDVTSTIFKQSYIAHEYTEAFDYNKVMNFYEKDVVKYLEGLNSNFSKSQNIVLSKYFIFPIGANVKEIYGYSKILWNTYTKSNKCPYTLDGLIYTAVQQKYVIAHKRESIIYKILKWKPSSLNSIDFYIEFDKIPGTSDPVVVFDNTNLVEEKKDDTEEITKEMILNKKYNILKLYVGKKENNVEVKQLFQELNKLYNAYIYIDDKGYCKDIEGKIIEDKTVVEFAYKNDSNLEMPFRWVPLRTRDDKTDMVRKYRQKYGNAEFVANNIWSNMNNPIEFSDIELLANESTYNIHLAALKKEVTTESIIQSNIDNQYYQKISGFNKPFRSFHNILKSVLIYYYGNLIHGKNKTKLDVLDIGCGKGGDIQKFAHAKIGTYVGFDLDPSNIYSSGDSCTSRYKQMKVKLGSLFKQMYKEMIFLVGNAAVPMNYEDQNRVLGQLIEQNKIIFSDIFGKTINDTHKSFDLINSQFNIHYFLENDITWNNYCGNIKRLLRKDGFFIFTTFDGQLINDSFNENGQIIEYYTNNTGQQEIIFDIQKKYTETNLEQTGLAINVLMAWNRYDYAMEYLVHPKFIIKELKEKANLELIETDLFGTFYELNREFFVNSTKLESVPETNKVFSNVREYYNVSSDLIKNTLKYSKLSRYYVFRKIDD
jgi:SAM-dependent methyltransferase